MNIFLVDKTTTEQWRECSTEDINAELKDLEDIHLDLARHMCLLRKILVERSKVDLKYS